MHILSIETSCDETALSIIRAEGDFPHATYTILGDALFSQIDIHREFGGVFPAVAKREHIATIVPMLEKALTQAALPSTPSILASEACETLQTFLLREPGVADRLIELHKAVGRPAIDLIAVTSGPGLEPALWVGVNTAKALGYLWDITVVGVDHMEGHILASIFNKNTLAPLTFPALSLLVSGGHTEFILMNDWSQYQKIGGTRDDAVGEAFDKVARLIGLPYPGGPEISRLAFEARERGLPAYATLPHPMLKSGDLDFSFSGLKTAVRYAIAEKILADDEKKAIARDFEDAAITVLLAKTKTAIEQYNIKSFILGGGVSANTPLRAAVAALAHSRDYPDLDVYLPERSLSTDNSIMIALVGHAHFARALSATTFAETIRANGNQTLANHS